MALAQVLCVNTFKVLSSSGCYLSSLKLARYATFNVFNAARLDCSFFSYKFAGHAELNDFIAGHLVPVAQT